MSPLIKTVLEFLEPTGLLWLVLSVALVVMIRRRRWLAIPVLGAAWLLLTLVTASPLSQALLASLESEWPQVDVAQLPECDAIIVLGGGTEPSLHEPAGIHLKGASDRLFAGLKLARVGKGRFLVLGGGGIPTTTAIVSEAEGAMHWVEDWKLSPVPVQSLSNSVDTHDEAIQVSVLATKNGWQRVALVTSAYHMTRAKAVFEKAGVTVVPIPCNYLSTTMRDRQTNWLNVPNAGNLGHFETWMHEIVGWWAYRIRGWI